MTWIRNEQQPVEQCGSTERWLIDLGHENYMKVIALVEQLNVKLWTILYRKRFDNNSHTKWWFHLAEQDLWSFEDWSTDPQSIFHEATKPQMIVNAYHHL